MDINGKTIKETLLKGERVTLECKKAKAEVPKSVWQTYSAFANTIGGLILLGVDEDLQEKDVSRRFQIIGVDEPSKIITDFWNTINSDKVNENILLDSDVEVVDMDGAQIVCIHVPQADWMAKPIYLNGNVYKGTYRRNNEGDYHCTEAQVKAMIRDSNADGNDSILIEYYGMDDIDPDSLRQYRTEFRLENNTHVWNRVDDKTFLRNLGGYTEDRQTGREGLTLAGLMMFGKGLAIRDRFANFRMDYLDMSHLVGDERYHDRLTYDGLWENNLYQFFRIVSPKVQFDLPRPFKLEKGGKRNLLKLPVETIYRGGNSKARNPKIQNMLRMIGFGENVGSGFPKIIAAWKETNWGEPQLLNKLDVDEVELVLPVPSTKSSGAGVSEGVSNRVPNGVSDTAKTIYSHIKGNPNISRSELVNLTGISLKNVQKHINRLKELGFIRRIGSTRLGYWEIIK